MASWFSYNFHLAIHVEELLSIWKACLSRCFYLLFYSNKSFYTHEGLHEPEENRLSDALSILEDLQIETQISRPCNHALFIYLCVLTHGVAVKEPWLSWQESEELRGWLEKLMMMCFCTWQLKTLFGQLTLLDTDFRQV